MARHLVCVVLKTCSAFVKNLDQYGTVLALPLGHSCSITHPSCIFHEPFSRKQGPLGYANASIVEDTSPSCSFFVALSSSADEASKARWLTLFQLLEQQVCDLCKVWHEEKENIA